MSNEARLALRLQYLEDSISFQADGGSVESLPMSTWPTTLTSALENPERWFALAEAWSSELVTEIAPGHYKLPYASYRLLPANIRAQLGLPAPEVVRVEILTDSNAGDPSFRIEYRVRHPAHGRLDQLFPRRGPAFVIDANTVVFLEENIEQLLGVVDRALPTGAGIEDRLEHMATVKELAVGVGASIDEYMASELVETVDTVSVEPRLIGPAEVHINPIVTDRSGRPVKLPPRRKAPRVVHRPEGRKRHRQILTERARHVYHDVVQRPVIRGADVPRLVTNPEAFVPEGIDLALYSDRVKDLEVRVYNSRPYIHVRESSGGWLEGAVRVELEDVRDDRRTEGSDGEAKQTPTLSASTLKTLKRKAQETGEDWVLDEEGRWIRLGGNERRFAEALSDSSSTDAYQPIQGMLRILENLDLLEYVKGDPDVLEELRRKHTVPQLKQPESFNGDLLPHQLSGFRWLASIEDRRLGGLLADDMGLGKTVQVLAHLSRLNHAGLLRPTLIVVPLTLIDNWERETRRFLGDGIAIHRHEGERGFRMRGLRQGADLVFVSYDTLRRDQLELAKVDWKAVVCDEAQFVKNPTAQRTSVVKALKADHRVALTGTPVENGLIEFWCIMDFVQPGLLGSWSDFRGSYERPIIEADESKRRELVTKLQHDLSPHYLRRLKDDVLSELPPRLVERESVGLSEQQLREYREIAHQGMSGGRGAALAAIGRLLQLSATPPSSMVSAPMHERILACPKLGRTLDLIERIRQRGEKVTLFTRFLAVQRLLQDAINYRFGLFPDCINGSVTGRRQQIIDIFGQRQGFNAIIMSHDVAGVGLNVTAANHVIHYTRPWNPAKENQASDRTHRIGQTRPVTIYLPIVVDDRFQTVEAKLDDLLREKEGLAKDVLVPRKDWDVKPEDLFECLKMEDTAQE